VPLPDSISVKYSEDDAQFISIRPLVRQSFRPAELIDMIVSVTGKDSARVAQILRSGTIVFNSYRYWWDALNPDSAALSEILNKYPDAQPSRAFRPEDCTEAILESAGTPPRHSLRLRREVAAKKHLLRSRSFWDTLMDLTRNHTPTYSEYSYAQRADIYALNLDAQAIIRLSQDAARYAPRSLRAQLAILPKIAQAIFICPRH
jgi:hypothetical protein